MLRRIYKISQLRRRITLALKGHGGAVNAVETRARRGRLYGHRHQNRQYRATMQQRPMIADQEKDEKRTIYPWADWLSYDGLFGALCD